MQQNSTILTINGGSSSIKFALYQKQTGLSQLLNGQIERIGTKNTTLEANDVANNKKETTPIDATNHEQAVNYLINWLQKQQHLDSITAIGHRIVHGMKHTAPELITPALIDELKQISTFDPEHLPGEIALIEAFIKQFPELPQIACFDTSFHTSMPVVAKMLPIPRRYYEKGIQRYGFHGLSYAYLMKELTSREGVKAAKGKIILAHLGSGASLAAVKDGKSIDTSMGFTPTSGISMGTRTGDLDPGVAWYFMQAEKMNADQFSHLINHESGLLGVSETSADMRELIKTQPTDNRAAEAIDLFCYQAKKRIGSFAAVLGGLDMLVFSGGIGEHSPEVRSKICKNMQFLGIELDETKNAANETIISTGGSKVVVHVITTNEELMIAKLVTGLLETQLKN